MRLFLALSVPADIARGLAETLNRPDLPRARVLNRSLWHITLAFLGDVPEVDLPLITNACEAFADCPGSITLSRLETFPRGGPHALVGLGTEHPREAWTAFISNLRDAMLSFAPGCDQKSWRPHVTVGRGPSKGILPVWGTDIGPWTWRPDGFMLMQSMLGPEGSTYKTLHVFPFRV